MFVNIPGHLAPGEKMQKKVVSLVKVCLLVWLFLSVCEYECDCECELNVNVSVNMCVCGGCVRACINECVCECVNS